MPENTLSCEKPLRHCSQSLTVWVGDVEISKPCLIRRSEKDFAFKLEFSGLPDFNAYEYKNYVNAQKFFARVLGPKFALRYYAAHYWAWLGDHFDLATQRMLTHHGRHYRKYNEALVQVAHKVKPYILQAQKDRLHQLIAPIVIFQKSPQEIRAEVGRSVWRRMHGLSRSNAKNLMTACHLHDDPRGDFIKMLEVAPSITGSGAWLAWGDDFSDAVHASRICPRKKGSSFDEARHLVRDTREMLGDRYNPNWSLNRLTREHDDAAKGLALKSYPAEKFRDEWRFDDGERRAIVLTSQAEIAAEGIKQGHCVASYAAWSASGKYAVFQVEGPERATLGLSRVSGSWQIDQVYGKFNRPVSDETRSFCVRALMEFQAHEAARIAA